MRLTGLAAAVLLSGYTTAAVLSPAPEQALVYPNHASLVAAPPLDPVQLVQASQHVRERKTSQSEDAQYRSALRLLKKHKKQHKYSNKIILLRHGEKDEDGSTGLNKVGKLRAQCFRKLFGRGTEHNIGLILAENYDRETLHRKRPYDTVKHLAKDLGLKVNLECEVDDSECVQHEIERFAHHSDKDIMICWKHSTLNSIAEMLGAVAKQSYPDDRFDIMWIMQNRHIIRKATEQCPGIDYYRNPPDRDLEIEADDDMVLDYVHHGEQLRLQLDDDLL